MKKKALVLFLVGALMALCACKGASTEKTTTEGEKTHGSLFGTTEDVPCYYGCPTSKRVKKLNMRKRKSFV